MEQVNASERLVSKALVPVLITKRPLSAASKTFLLPTYFSPASKQAVQEALTLADLPLQHISWERPTVSGPAGTSILNQADQCQADVIVMSTHGRNGLAHMLLGGVTEEVAQTAPNLILTIRPDAFQFELPQ